MNVPTSSPARTGRKLLPKYPAAVAQNVTDTLTPLRHLSRMRHRRAQEERRYADAGGQGETASLGARGNPRDLAPLDSTLRVVQEHHCE
jgi:hypothetical protein